MHLHNPKSVVVLAAIGLLAGSSIRWGYAQDAGRDFFELRVRPVLASKCYDCHTDSAKGGLRLDSREALLKGGKHGPAVIPGNPGESLLIKAILQPDDSLRMPRGRPGLSENEIADLTQWISDGANWPQTSLARNDYLIRPEQRRFWSFQPLRVGAAPFTKGAANNAVDAFILAKLENANLALSQPADKRTLIRRATFDLTGLPPTMREIREFEADRSPGAFAKVVDRLLASPRYGERWGRHWLDLARYSDTLGMVDAGKNLQGWFPFAYTYRDWVIRAINDDLPYDQFIIQQIAADRISGNSSGNLAALGFLSLSRDGLGVNIHEKIDDKIDVVSRGLMGLTVSCARCHNHKFDPIPTSDYYSFYTIFNNTREPEAVKLPLLDPSQTGSNKYSQAFDAEKNTIDREISAYREKRFPELLALYRTAPEIAKILVGVAETRLINDEKELKKLALEHDYNAFLLVRWRDYLTQPGVIGSLWNRLTRLPESEFAAKAGGEIDSLPGLNSLVAEAFRQPPVSLRDAAEVLGKLLATHDGAQMAGKPEAEELRRILRGPDSPTSVAFADYEKISLTTDRQNEEGKLRRLENLFLSQAYEGAPPRAQSLEDVSELKPGYIFVRGKPENKGDAVVPQFLRILSDGKRKPFTNGSGRLELAQAIADPSNPLTARVFVNRVWQHHFGNGLVRTPSDFGVRGEAPTHPELLDYLADYFVSGGWSIKKLHRLIMLSKTYQQASSNNPAALQLDPEDRLLWRFNRRRLDLEELRDSLLSVSGRLDGKMFGLPTSAQAWPYSFRRTVYSFIDRALVPGDFRAFDFADPNTHSAQRILTTVPQQALVMMNSPFVIELAKSVLSRPEIAGAKTTRQRIESLYQAIYGRLPNTEELTLGTSFLAAQAGETPQKPGAQPEAVKLSDDWQYGEGEYDEKADHLSSFRTFPWFVNGQWRNSPIPGDPRRSTALLTRKGGIIGDGKEFSAIRRWTAPFDGRIAISGLFQHSNQNATCRTCKPALPRIVSSRTGTIAKWEVLFSEAASEVASLEVKRGDNLDFVMPAGKGTSGGQFTWTINIKRLDVGGQSWDSARDFREPSPGELDPWDRYVHALLMAAEFIIVD